METIVYCGNCGVVPLPRGHIELCSGCITEIVQWLENAEQERHADVQAEETTYQKQFSL